MRSFGFAAALAALALTAAPASAAEPLALTSASPAGRTALAPMTDVTFSAGFATAVESPSIRVSDQPPGPDGLLPTEIDGGPMGTSPLGSSYGWHLPAQSAIRIRPGTYWWQVSAFRRNAGGTLERAAAPAQRVDFYFPSAWSRRGPIDRRFGRHGHVRFWLSSRGIPDGVDPARLRTLAAVSARRWGLRLAGWTTRPAGAQDHVNVAGFGFVPSSGALAVQADLYQRLYRVSRRCSERRLNGVVVQRSCGPLQRRYVRTVVTDHDLIVRTDVAWAMGPVRPTRDEYDLETVLVHELGHMAGNHRHASRCANTPMGRAIAMGEWWRTPHDWYRRGCPLSAPGGVF
jgi:hypothetical protein